MRLNFASPNRDPNIAIDLGTALTRIASGNLNRMVVPSRIEGRPVVRSGAIMNVDAAVELLRPLLYRARKFGVLRPNAVACASSGADDEERETLRECIAKAGAATVVIVPEILAAAIGAGMDVSSHYAGMIVDIGEGITECAVIRSGRIIEAFSVRTGCSDLRHCVLETATSVAKRRIPEAEAERIMRESGIAGKKEPLRILFTGCPEGFASIPGEKMSEKIEPVLNRMTGAVRALLESLSPDLACEVIDSGICLSGGGALLRGMREHLERLTGIPVATPARPLDSVVAGAREMFPVMSILNRHMRQLH